MDWIHILAVVCAIIFTLMLLAGIAAADVPEERAMGIFILVLLAPVFGRTWGWW